MNSARRWLVSAGACLAFAGGVNAAAQIGADQPWTPYEAEAMRTNGTVLGPTFEPNRVETESSGQKCVRLATEGDHVEFAAAAAANALVLRYNLPDPVQGGGTAASLELFVNGQRVRKLALTSHYAWVYGRYPFTNDPKDGKPRNFYDELRVKDLQIAKSDVVRLEKTAAGEPPCIVDLVDLENVPAPLGIPANSLSVLDFGAGGQGKTDDTEPLRKCMAAAVAQGRAVWVPAGEYKLTGDIVLPSDVTIQGAGMWHTTFVGDEELYGQADRRVRFKLTGSGIHLADFAIVGRLNYRNDDEPNDGVVGARCADSSVSRVWIEHTKVGVWIYNGTNLRIEGCRFRDLLADGINLCVATTGTVVENCSARGTGDDCFAIWPTASDQGFVDGGAKPGNNVFRRCTAQLPFLANGVAVYGGAGNRVEDCLLTDISAGCGLLISTTFPTADEARKIDNNFSGTTVVQRCELRRCGGYDHTWAWRAALQICMERRSISGLLIRDVQITDSISDGLSVVAPGKEKGQGTLSSTRLERVSIRNSSIGTPGRADVWIRPDASGSLTWVGPQPATAKNESPTFTIATE